MPSVRSAPPRLTRAAPAAGFRRACTRADVRRAALLLAGLLTAFGGRSAAAQTGSGTVAFTFLSFSGPFAISTQPNQNDPSTWIAPGQVNGVRPTTTGWAQQAPTGSGDYGYVTGSTTFAAPTGSVALRYDRLAPSDPGGNLIQFTPRPFANVAVGQDFVLGTLTFENGFWHGGGQTAAFNTPTDLRFRITTTSGDGAAFNQSAEGTIRMVVNAPFGNDTSTLAGKQAEADWLYLTGPAIVGSPGAFRVYDACCRPTGVANIGSVDVVARFGSIEVVGLTNARGGGFLTSGVTPLPPVPPGGPGTTVPEPGTWALLAAGLAALGVRRARPAEGLA